MAPRSPLLLAAVWAAGAAVAVGTGLLAVDLVGAQVGDPVVPPLSAEAARSVTAGPGTTPASPPPASPGRTATPGPSATTRPPAATGPRTRTFTVAGGTVGVRCDGATPRLLYATPAQGYRVDQSKAEGGRVEVRFRSEEDDSRLRVVCVSGTPTRDPSGG